MKEKQFWAWVDLVRASGDMSKEAEAEIQKLPIVDAVWIHYWQWVANTRLRTWPLFDFLEMAFDGSFGDGSFMKVSRDAVENPDTVVPVLRGRDRYEMLGGDGPYDKTILYVDFTIEDQIKDLDPKMLPPDHSWPELSGASIDEEDWKKHFPVGYQEYIVEGKVFE